jgi:hypothetical protein
MDTRLEAHVPVPPDMHCGWHKWESNAVVTFTLSKVVTTGNDGWRRYVEEYTSSGSISIEVERKTSICTYKGAAKRTLAPKDGQLIRDRFPSRWQSPAHGVLRQRRRVSGPR